MGNRPHFMADTCSSQTWGLAMRPKSLRNRGRSLCATSADLPQHRLTCECGWCTWHRAALRRWPSGGWSRPGWRPDWCCPGPRPRRPCSPSPGEQGHRSLIATMVLMSSAVYHRKEWEKMLFMWHNWWISNRQAVLPNWRQWLHCRGAQRGQWGSYPALSSPSPKAHKEKKL